MARDYENLHDLEDLDDIELRDLVRERLTETGGLDVDNITVRVEDGVVHLLGRVGTEGELRIAEHVVTDVLGIRNYENELVVDAVRRSQLTDDPEEAAVEEGQSQYLGESPQGHQPSEEQNAEDLDARLYGTTDVQQAIERGTSYHPPQEPTPEGLTGTERGPETYNEDH